MVTTISGRAVAALAALTAAATVGACATTAQPRTFPDLSTFTEIAPGSPLISTGRVGKRALFSTADGLHCDADAHSQTCWSAKVGQMPGFPSSAPHLPFSCGPETEKVSSSDSGAGFVYTATCEGFGPAPVLHPGQKVTIVDANSCSLGDYHVPNCAPGVHGQATCVAGDSQLTACTNGAHGFVLRPSGSWTF